MTCRKLFERDRELQQPQRHAIRSHTPNPWTNGRDPGWSQIGVTKSLSGIFKTPSHDNVKFADLCRFKTRRRTV